MHPMFFHRVALPGESARRNSIHTYIAILDSFLEASLIPPLGSLPASPLAGNRYIHTLPSSYALTLSLSFPPLASSHSAGKISYIHCHSIEVSQGAIMLSQAQVCLAEEILYIHCHSRSLHAGILMRELTASGVSGNVRAQTTGFGKIFGFYLFPNLSQTQKAKIAECKWKPVGGETNMATFGF